jgi:hypothetical protein
MAQLRRKSPFAAAAPAAAKPDEEEEEAPARRHRTPLSLAGLLVSIFLVATFLYNEQVAVVRPPAAADAVDGDFPLAGAVLARSAPDLRLLQDDHHRKVNSRPQREEEEKQSFWTEISRSKSSAHQLFR